MFLIKSVQLFQVIIFQLFSFTKIQKIKGALYLDNFCFHQKWPCTVAEETQTSSVASDNSSGKFNAGFPIDVVSYAVLLSIIYRPNIKTFTLGGWYETQFKWWILRLHYKIKYRVVIYWETLEKISHYTFYNELRVSPDEHPVLLAEAPLN